jgi:hypothetical protein
LEDSILTTTLEDKDLVVNGNAKEEVDDESSSVVDSLEAVLHSDGDTVVAVVSPPEQQSSFVG